MFPIVALAFAPAFQSGCPGWDPRFADGTLNGGVNALVRFDDGTGLALYAGGVFGQAGGQVATAVARWNGERWSALQGGGANAAVHALAVFDDGNGPRLYAAGEFTSLGGQQAFRVARWEGNAWSPLGIGTSGTVRALAVYDDGNGPALFAGGDFALAGGQSVNRIARWDGAAWSGVGGGTSGPVHALAVHDAGNGPALFAGGGFLSAGSAPARNVARWDGQSWSILGNGTNATVRALVSLEGPSGPVLCAGGDFLQAGGLPAAHIAGWDGQSWSQVGLGLDGPVKGLAVHDLGGGPALFAVGAFAHAGGADAARVARWSGGSWSGLGTGLAGEVRASALWDSGTGPRLVVGGQCTLPVDGAEANVLAWDGAHWSTLAHGLLGSYARGLIRHDDGSGMKLYAGSWFVEQAGASTVHGMLRWDGTRWEDAGPDDSNFRVNEFAVFDEGSGPRLFVVGPNLTAGNVPGQVVDAVGIARWDGASWSAVGGSLGNSAYSAHVSDLFGVHALYVGGPFTTAGGQPARGIARWDGASWTSLATTITGTPQINIAQVVAWCDFDDGSGPALYLGGAFGSINGVVLSNVARWNGSTYSALASGLTSPAPYIGIVRDLIVYDHGTGPALYAGGIFSLDGAPPGLGLARWTGSSWVSVVQAPFDDVNALEVFDDGSGRGPLLLMATDRGILSWDGTTLASFGSTGTVPNEAVDSLLSIPAEGGAPAELWAAGNFSTLGGEPSSLVGRFEACIETGRLSCFGDGSGTPCPCGNASQASDRAGCLHSQGLGGTLRARGHASLSDDTLELVGGSMPNSAALYFHGASLVAGGAGVAFGDGIKCTGGPFVRLGTLINSGGGSVFPLPGGLPVSVQGQIGAPGTRHYQLRYRNSAPFCTVEAFNYTNALSLVWAL